MWGTSENGDFMRQSVYRRPIYKGNLPISCLLNILFIIPLRKFGQPIHARLSTMDLSLIYERDSRPSRILQCDWLRAAETIRQELELYHTWILKWEVKPHNKSTFRLVSEKWNDKMFKRNTFLGPFLSKYRQKEFSAKIRICHFLDGKIRQHWLHRSLCLRGPI